MPKTSKQSESEQLQADPNLLRDAILDAAMPHVPFDGWGKEAAIEGAKDIGLDPSAALRAVPRGAGDMIAWHLRRADRLMAEALVEKDLPSMRIRDRITTAVRLRLEQNAPNKDAIRKAMAFLALPQNAPMAAQALYRTVDEMWFAAGDTATDWNFYSKRAILAGVYSSTVLFWLNDKSEDHEATWAFLDRRIADAMRVPKVTGKLSSVLGFPLRRAKALREFGVRAGG